MFAILPIIVGAIICTLAYKTKCFRKPMITSDADKKMAEEKKKQEKKLEKKRKK